MRPISPYLDEAAREKMEEMTEDARKDYSQEVSHLKGYLESFQQHYVARQKLSFCIQNPTKSCSAFANRVVNLCKLLPQGRISLRKRIGSLRNS